MTSTNFFRKYTAQVIYVATFPWNSLSASTTSSIAGNSLHMNSRSYLQHCHPLKAFSSSSCSRQSTKLGLSSALPAFADRSFASLAIFGKATTPQINRANITPLPSSQSISRSTTLFKMSTTSSTTTTTTTNNTPSPKINNRVALLQFEVTANKSQNLQTAQEYIQKAKEAGASLCVLPEIWNSPYATSAFGEYAELLPNVGESLASDDSSSSSSSSDWGPSSKMLKTMAQTTGMYIVGGSIPELSSEKLYNTCLIINPRGEIVGKHRKVHLFDVDVPGGICFKESETLSAGGDVTYFDVEEDEAGEGSGLGRIGVGICYDIRFPEYALLLTQIHNCKILIYPGAFNLTTGPAHWELLQRARAVDGQCFVLTASPARMPPPENIEDDDENDDGDGKKKKTYPHYSAWGHSTVVSPWGEIIATCEEGPDVVIADLDMTKVEEMRMAIPTMGQKREDLYRLVDGGKDA